MKHADSDGEAELGEANKAATGAILDMYQGLSLALVIAGASLQSTKRADERQNARSGFYEDLESKRKNLLNISRTERTN